MLTVCQALSQHVIYTETPKTTPCKVPLSSNQALLEGQPFCQNGSVVVRECFSHSLDVKRDVFVPMA